MIDAPKRAELEREIMVRFGMEPKEDWYDSYRYDDRLKLRDFIEQEIAKARIDENEISRDRFTPGWERDWFTERIDQLRGAN